MEIINSKFKLGTFIQWDTISKYVTKFYSFFLTASLREKFKIMGKKHESFVVLDDGLLNPYYFKDRALQLGPPSNGRRNSLTSKQTMKQDLKFKQPFLQV